LAARLARFAEALVVDETGLSGQNRTVNIETVRRSGISVKVKGLFRPHYTNWSEQQRIEFRAPEYLRNIIRIITETGLRVYKELMPMKPLTDLASEAFREQIRISEFGRWLFPNDERSAFMICGPLTRLA